MKNIFILLSAIILVSCQKVIDINPPTGEERVIIQGYLYADSTARVIITKSTAYLNNSKPPSLGTATVTLSDNHGTTELLSWNPMKQQFESAAMKGVVNDTYTLTVNFEGKTYAATSILPALEKNSSIEIVHKDADPSKFTEEGYYMQLSATLSLSNKLYYLFKGYENDSLLNDINYINYQSNENTNGNIEHLDIYRYETAGKEAKLEIYSLTKPAYDFYNAASLQLNNDGGFFSTPPANVPSMFDNNAIGLFQCSDIQVLKAAVQ